MRILATFLAACAALGFDAALACTCGSQTREEAFKGADLLFDGIVEAIDVRAGGQDDLDDRAGETSDENPIVGRAATFRVEREIKGVGEATRVVDYNIETGGNCGMSFETGKRYRVYAYENDGRWGTGSCSYTTELLLAPEERNYDALDEAERLAKARPDDLDAQSRVDRIRREIDDEYYFKGYLKEVFVAADADFDRISRAFDATFKLNDFERAEALARRAVEGFPDDSIASLMLAKALREREKPDEALMAAERARFLDPDDLDAQDIVERLRFVVRGETTPGRRDYRMIYAKKLDARKCVAPKADFSGGAFVEADFSGADLTGARFNGVVAKKILFNEARLSGARFDRAGKGGEFARSKGVYGLKAEFNAADLRAASFSKTYFSTGAFQSADLRNADFSGATIQGADFSAARLAGAKFPRAEFYGTKMDHASLGDADFADSSAVNISWRGADMRLAWLAGANLAGGIIDCETRLPRGFPIKGSGLIPEKSVCGRKAQARDFSGVKWPMFLRLHGFDLSGADFSGGEFDGGEFQNAELTGADFSKTKGYATFSGADLTGAAFRKASIRARFAPFSDVDGRSFAAADLRDVDFSGARLEADTFLSGEGTSVRLDLDLSTAKFDGAHLICEADFHRRQISELAEFEADPREPRYGRKDWGTFLKRQAEEAYAYLDAEGALVRFIAGKWPTATFSAQCAGYSMAADARVVTADDD